DWECPTAATFTDVVVGSQFHCYIEWLAETGITTGWDVGTHREFRPVLNIERQAMSAFLYRGLAYSAGFDTPRVPSFTDKNPADMFFRYVEWMADTGITTGWPDDTFRPLNGVERQAMAAFIYRAAGSPEFTAPTTASFRDVPVGAAFFHEIEWMASTGITTGWQYEGYRLFRPSAYVERQAMAAFLYRAFNNEDGHLDDTHLNRP
ncbi:MAG: S-layer homology domain-containing protein, partial [Promicromonosporaceae bacterium]|nr:S-layer homology domain-containing protein [Promicromonosporaceae bacterium]